MKKFIPVVFTLAIMVLGINLFSQTNGGFKWMEGLSSAASYYPIYGMTTDDVGNVYVTGTWSGNASFGNSVYLTNSGNQDFGYLAKYTKDGVCVWAKEFSTNNYGVDSHSLSYFNNAVYISGGIDGSATFGTLSLNIDRDQAAFLVKADTAGNFLWAKAAECALDGEKTYVTTDNGGNIIWAASFSDTAFIGGDTHPSLGNSDIFVAKYTQSGNKTWSYAFGGLDSDKCNGVTTDENNNIYFTGTFGDDITFGTYVLQKGSALYESYYTKLNPSGTVLWAKRAGGTREVDARAIDCDIMGSLYVTGSYWGTATYGTHSITANNPTSWYGDAFFVKLDYDGNFKWAKSGGGNGQDEGNSIVADRSGNIFVTGTLENQTTFGTLSLGTSGANKDMFIVKLNPAGTFVWGNASQYNSETTGSAMTKGIRGNLYCGGNYYYYTKFDTIDILSQEQTHQYIVNYTTENIWKGNTNDWDYAANWSFGHFPTTENFVYVSEDAPGNYFPHIKNNVDAVTDGLEISDNAYLDIEIGGSLTCKGVFTNNGDFIVRSNFGGNGSFIDNGFIENNDTISINRYYDGSAWHLISPPISNANAGVFMYSYLQSYSEPSQAWTYISDPSTMLATGQGYAVWTNETAQIAQFIGTPNTGTVKMPLTVAGSTWNLLGNPYPSSIDWDAVTIPTNMNNAIYYLDASSGNYVSYINGVGTGSRYIPPSHGFMVKATATDTLVFNNDDRAHDGANTNYKGGDAEYISLSVNHNDISDDTYIYFNSNATAGMDLKYDAEKLFNENESVAQLYTVSENTDLSINALNGQQNVNLAFKPGTNENYSIRLNHNIDGQKIYLEDKFTGQITDLTINDYYFDANPADDVDRFIVHFALTGISKNKEENIYFYNNKLYFTNLDIQTNDMLLQLFDLQGRLVVSEMISPNTNQITIDQTSGWYLVRLANNYQNSTHKIYVD